MKWKPVLVTAVIALLVGALVVLSLRTYEPQREIRNRIGQYKLINEEQQLITDILKARYEAAVIRSKLQPTPQPQNVPPKPKE